MHKICIYFPVKTEKNCLTERLCIWYNSIGLSEMCIRGGEWMISEQERAFLKTGFKEVLKSVEKNLAEKIFIAEDVSSSMKDKLTIAAENSGCSILYIETMKELGKICGIDVGASCACILKH